MARSETLTVPFIGPSLNAIYAGIHWTKRKKHADAAHLAIKVSCKGVKPFTKPVSLEFQPMHRGRGYDTSNYSYNNKLLEDGLVMVGILGGDSIGYVQEIISRPTIKVKKPGESHTIITITEES